MTLLDFKKMADLQVTPEVSCIKMDQDKRRNGSFNQVGNQKGGKPTRERCKKMHIGVCCDLTKTCFNCGHKGHSQWWTMGWVRVGYSLGQSPVVL